MVTASQIAAARKRTKAQYLADAKVTVTRIDPGEVTYVDGRLITAPGTITYSGPASISAARQPVTMTIGGETVQIEAWLIRAPLDAQSVQPGDKIVVDEAGDLPLAHRDLWVHHIPGRQTAVLARIIATATRPGSVDGHR